MHVADVMKRAPFAHGIVKLVVIFDEIGFDPDEKYGHAGNDGNISQKNREVVDQRSPERANNRLAGIGMIPEDELVGPYRRVIEDSWQHEKDRHSAPLEKIELDKAVGLIGISDGEKHTDKEKELTGEKSTEEPFEPERAKREPQK